ncbi:linoleate 13S-lipoxygenase 3-1, chloroplastic isoform X1 [Coffea arabica]|uniref:Lipoxygenase n=1 Tax=Coffea arabica TaxID=13443 RepID=A0A6P6WCN7_COFAR
MAACNILLASSTRFLLNVKPFQRRKKLFTFNSILPNYTRKPLEYSSKAILGHAETCSVEEKLAKTEKDEPSRTISLSAIVTVKCANPTDLKDVIFQLMNASSATNGRGVVLQLVSSELDPHTREPKLSREAVLNMSYSNGPSSGSSDPQTFRVQFTVDHNFGVPGAIMVYNKYEKEFFLVSISVEGFVNFDCKSWIQPQKVNSRPRVFFSNKAYLPFQTPAGLKKLRERELQELRGDGTGTRLASDRIYDYDVYNDLGDPDKGIEHARPALGGQQNPHPRRCRTGRPPTIADANAEIPAGCSKPVYVPRDEEFEESKSRYVSTGKLKAVFGYLMFSLVPNLYSDVTNLKIKLPHYQNNSPPGAMGFSDLGDDEFALRVLAGINPLNIERLTNFPPRSKLDPSIYGPLESALKEEHIISHLDGMSVQQAMDKKKLFILDYHDLYLPILNQINALDDRKSYATRTLFFLTSAGTLKPVAIELSLPKGELTVSSKQVLTPPIDDTSNWLWQLAKAHVCTNDSGVHQLVNHWLRVHACMEPVIIAAHRQLSIMHPIFKLLKPHLRYTLRVNTTARETLINAGGTIESFYAPGQYCMQLACSAYRDFWRFDQEGLPADLIRRGIAVPDPKDEHGLRLLIEDYPYANDGLLYWSAIDKLVKTYVNHYYPNAVLIQDDKELQAWYREVINVGHADHRFATWWPNLETPDDLIKILTTLIWIASGEHAALNFGQYGRFDPSHPNLMRKLLPQENDPEYASFLENPKEYFLSSLPSLDNSAKFASVLSVISAHSSDEEYIGQRDDLLSWSGGPEILEAFYRFFVDIKMIEREIEERNSDSNLRNRCAVGIPPYELLIPSSGNGATSRGVPNSITV